MNELQLVYTFKAIVIASLHIPKIYTDEFFLIVFDRHKIFEYQVYYTCNIYDYISNTHISESQKLESSYSRLLVNHLTRVLGIASSNLSRTDVSVVFIHGWCLYDK